MNKARRKAIEEIIDQLGTLKEQIESVCEEEQEAYDNLPESIQYSERGEAMSEAASDLEDAASSIDDVMSTLQDIIER
jgi:ABC-type transporter Mla subunit MlaD